MYINHFFKRLYNICRSKKYKTTKATKKVQLLELTHTLTTLNKPPIILCFKLTITSTKPNKVTINSENNN